MKRFILLTLFRTYFKMILLCLLFGILLCQNKEINNKAATDVGFIQANNVKALVSNDGILFGNFGFIVPSPVFTNNKRISSIFTAGFFIGGKVDDKVRVSRSYYYSDFQPGSWDEYQKDTLSLNDPNWKIYTYYSNEHVNFLYSLLESDVFDIRNFAQSEIDLSKESNQEWELKAIPQGAPAVPKGDVAVFYILHDSRSSGRHASSGKDPLNIQIRVTQWVYRSTDVINNTVFTKIEMINKNLTPIEEAYFSFWSDVDLGIFYDDKIGSDINLKLAYVYNAETDDHYTTELGLAPPAIGFDFLQGPLIDSTGSQVAVVDQEHNFFSNDTTNKTNTFLQNRYIRSPFSVNLQSKGEAPFTADGWYLLMKGISGDNKYIQDKAINEGLTTIENSQYIYNGDPVSEMGWIDNGIGDKRILINCGPFQLGVSDGTETFGDTGYNSIILAAFTSFGETNLNSVKKLKEEDVSIKSFFEQGMKNVNKLNFNYPDLIHLKQNYPNPFNPITTISFDLKIPTIVKLEIYNLLGQKVRTLIDQYMFLGRKSVIWDGKNDNGHHLSAGVYFYQLKTNKFRKTKKMVMIK